MNECILPRSSAYRRWRVWELDSKDANDRFYVATGRTTRLYFRFSFYIPAGIPQHLFLSSRDSGEICFHPARSHDVSWFPSPRGSRGIRDVPMSSPFPCRSLARSGSLYVVYSSRNSCRRIDNRITRLAIHGSSIDRCQCDDATSSAVWRRCQRRRGKRGSITRRRHTSAESSIR